MFEIKSLIYTIAAVWLHMINIVHKVSEFEIGNQLHIYFGFLLFIVATGCPQKTVSCYVA